jgi:hypothetical protein
MEDGASDEFETPSKSFSRIVENSVIKMSDRVDGDEEENDPFGDM